MYKYILKRLAITIPTLFAISLISFLIIHLSPGDPTAMMIDPKTRPEDRERIKKNLGLDKPLPQQYFIWLNNLVFHRDMGYSLVNGKPVLKSIMERLPNTLILMGLSYLTAILLALPLGIYSAVKQYSPGDYILTVLSFTGISIPSFWLGLMLICLFTVKLQLLPSIGTISPDIGDNIIIQIYDFIKHLIMPFFVLVFTNLAAWSRYVRSSMLEVLKADYIRTARAKGQSELKVLYKHALRNAMIPLITLIGLSLPDLLAGAFVTEMIFSWPGMGRLGMDAIFHRDYTVLMGTIMFSSIVIIVSNLITDIFYVITDPRIRFD
ncbi:MAG TPA: ABC transporter permease [Candidatus Eremiobacteraeota bacterium]|nr:MAG: Dipeptide transport system permease protein DppB [bacterium ADurb.Bin363]HPZ10695.1 ABC transporter permease [Candidatus Eremiobacteraeota bacterium]